MRDKKMNAVKIAVVIMSVLLVIGFSVVVVTIASRLSADDPDLVQKMQKGSSEPTTFGKKSTTFGEKMIDIPAGCRLDSLYPHGDEIIAVLTGQTPPCQQIRILNLTTGHERGRFVLRSYDRRPSK